MRFLAIFAAVFFASCSFANSYSIEDGDFSPASKKLSEQMESAKSFAPFLDEKCSLMQKKVALEDAERQTTEILFLTTSDQCGWGAALGPIWLVLNNSGEYKQIFHAGGYSIKALPTATNGLYNIQLIQGTAGTSKNRRYRFVDGEYTSY